MRFLCCATLFLTFAGLTYAIDADKLVGRWEQKNPGKGENLIVEFTKDGNVKIIQKLKGKDKTFEGTYRLEADKLTMNVHQGNKKKAMDKVVIIEKLTDEELVQTDEEKKTKTLMKAKAAATETPKAETPKTETPKTEATKTDEPLPIDPLPKGTLPDADFKLTAGEYLKEFKKDEKAAQAKYKGKIVELSGTVTMTGGPSLGAKTSHASIKTPDPKDPFAPYVMCISNDPEFFSRVGSGQTVRIKGKVGEFGSLLQSSEFVDRGPEKRIFVTSEMLAKDYSDDKEKALKKYDGRTVIITGTIAAIKQIEGGTAKFLQLKGDGKIAIDCVSFDDSFDAKSKVGETVKMYGSVGVSNEKSVRIIWCSPLATK